MIRPICSINHLDKDAGCYDLGSGPTNFSYPPSTNTPSAVTITLPVTVQPSTPVIPPSFATAIPEIPITWPTSHMHHYLSMEYLTDPIPVISDNSDEDSPMRTHSSSPAVKPSGSPVVFLEAYKQLLPPWQAWLSLPRLSRPKRRSLSPSSEESAPKHLCYNDGSYTPITSSATSPISPSTLPSPPLAASPNVDSPPMQINLL